jgi:hypothetical protein
MVDTDLYHLPALRTQGLAGLDGVELALVREQRKRLVP